ncbi:MAG: P pilus assembly chaperone PapD [Phenylobacterium sp.]|jgi:P pilus assembly chaperone PapD
MFKKLTLPLIMATTLATVMPIMTMAGTLSVNKPRILMTDKNKRAEFKVFNTSPDIQTLRISLIDKQMDEQGEIITVEGSQTSASDFLRVGPRVGKNIDPKGFQKFRVRAKLSKMPAGEYRSHLLVESMNPPTEQSKAGISVKPNIKYSIPIIIRHGELNAEVAISNAQLSEKVSDNGEKQTTLAFDMTRIGDRSVYGDFAVYQVTGDETILIKALVGQAIYTEVEKRQFSIELLTAPPAGSQLKLEFKENPEFGGDSQAHTLIEV